MSVLVEKEIGRVSNTAPVMTVGILVCDVCFISEKSAVHTALWHQNGELSLFSDH